MKTLILFLLSAVLVFGQAANDQLITQRKPDNSGNIQRNVPMESAISTTLASYRSALGLGTEDDPQFNTVRINDSDGSHYLGIAAGSDLTADRTLTLTTGNASRTITLNGNPTLNDWFDQSVRTTASPSFANISATGFSVTGGYRHAVTLNNALLHTAFFNDSTGTSAHSLSRLAGNGDDSARSLVATVYGTSYSGGGLAIQDGARLESGSGLSGGLVISVAANAPLIFAQNGAEVGRFNVSGQFETPVQIFTEGSAPSTPTSGRVAMYAKTDGRLYSMDDAGTETELGGGGSGDVTLNGNNAFTGDNSFAGSSTFTGITTFSAAEEIVYTAMPALEVDVTKAGNSYSATGNVTFTYSDATPAAGTSTWLRITADGTNRTITIPTTWSLARAGNITSLFVPAGTVLQVKLQYQSGRWEIIGDPPYWVEKIATFSVDGGGVAITTGTIAGTSTLSAAFRLVGWAISGTAATGTTTVTFWAKAYSTAIPTVANVINTSGVSLSSGTSVYSTTLTDFTDTQFAAQDQIRCAVTAVDGTATDLTVILYGVRL